MTVTSFISTIAPIAVRIRLEGSPIFPSVRIAQAGLETGWKIPPWNNLGGYKVGSGKLTPYWRGKIVNKGTWEVYDGKRVDVTVAFRAYDSVEDFFRDQDLLFQLPRYARVRSAKTPEEQADMLLACGYATDPQYAEKLKSIMNEYNLKKYDEEAVRVLEELKKQINELTEENKQLHRRINALEKQLEKRLQCVAAPAWFVKEFGSANLGDLIHEPEFTAEGWRTLAVALRAQGKGIGR